MSQTVQPRPRSSAVFASARVDVIRPGRPDLQSSDDASADVWSAIRSRFDELRQLPWNWDRRGSASIPPNTLAFAQQMLTSILPPRSSVPAVVALGDGGVQLVWLTVRGELEVEVCGPNKVHIFYLDRATGVEQDWDASTDFRKLSDILLRMHRP
jgi:hypothetical protein